ncbi:response regulator transcription factor [Portibacter lacus]|uniref:Phosphate regulon transcriptional regulatory protein PhoB n=1 Tax=Portibacter lacus TaxID=1099794 RepID=A0AA37SN06_9BACT|nr:response regulator transcription factor [Portibacter lacus]GLR17446.1 DNA-binding response regulator [Portibacter lacus]
MSKARILLVDDEPDILEMLSYNLEKEDYKIETATNGLDAIEKAKSFSPDLILLDIMMPEMDGVEVCYQLRENDQFADTIIAFLTARTEDFTQISALEAGGDDFILKPIKPNVFKSRIKALLRRNDKKDAKKEKVKFKFGPLVINTEKYNIRLDGKKIKMAKKEFELLLLLTSSPGKVFKREEILRKVWGREVIVGDRTIDVHIRKLREKIGNDYFKTLKGVGYKFEF